MPATELTTGRLAREGGVSVETIRYYERRGLIGAPPRSSGGFRLYGADAVRRVRFIRRAQRLGFTLREIVDLLALRTDRRANCADVKACAGRKIAEIDRRVADLRAMRRTLAAIAAACDGRGETSACPILDSLEAKDSQP